ncbi:hypothetical protein AAG906_028001 [Vitis piasezkii]
MAETDTISILKTQAQSTASGYTIVSTGGTTIDFGKCRVSATKVEQLTYFPEMLDGRVKLYIQAYMGVFLLEETKNHMEALNEHGIGTFDVMVGTCIRFMIKFLLEELNLKMKLRHKLKILMNQLNRAEKVTMLSNQSLLLKA